MRALVSLPLVLLVLGGCDTSEEFAPDARSVFDLGRFQDARPNADATSDAGVSADSGESADLGLVMDAGVSTPECGNAQIEVGEACDDGNTDDDDGCSNLCTLNAPFRAYDDTIRAVLSAWSIPGATVALTRNERLVHAKAYGFADAAQTRPMQPEFRFRIASVSKPITAVAILKLVERGLIALDEPAFERLPHLVAPVGSTPDPRLDAITIRHLLEHSGGWDRSVSGDPMFMSGAIAAAMNVPAPAEADAIVAYMKGQPLDFDPGSRFAYSNFGYSVLGRIIEVVTGDSYERHLKTSVLAPVGIFGMEIGRTRPELRPSDEVSYESHGMSPSVFPDVQGTVPVADGGWYNEALDSHGGWIASAPDLARFLSSVDGGSTRPELLSFASFTTMIARPALPDWSGADAWYALGWLVRPVGGGENLWHGGSLPGTTTLVVRTSEGFSWSVLLNSRPADPADFARLDVELDQAMWTALRTVTEWPNHDLFDRLP